MGHTTVNCDNPGSRSRKRPSHGLRRIPRWAGAVGLGCLLGLGAFFQAKASSHGKSPDGATGVSMGPMMRADIAPPLGVAGGMSPKQGVFMPSLRFMHMRMEGNRDGTNNLGTAEVLEQFPITPVKMDIDILMAGALYAFTDDLSVMAMLPYIWKSMDHVTRAGVEFTTKSESFGDLRVIGGYDVYKSGKHTVNLQRA